MSWTNVQSWLTTLLEPTPAAVVITVLVVLSIPLFLHLLIYSTTSSTGLPSFLLVGPSGSGKTSLLTLFERGHHAETRTSQVPLTVEISLPTSTTTASAKYRSLNDPSLQSQKCLLLIDTPGHGKLRYHAFDTLARPQNLRGLIFVVDAADLSFTTTSSDTSGNDAVDGLRQAAEYLHDLFLALQKRHAGSKSSKAAHAIPLLVAANKLDLFTALPPLLVKSTLEAEITRVRGSRGAGLLDSGVSMNDLDGGGEEKDWLGDGGEGPFKFEQMEEVGVSVSVVGGNVLGAEGPDVGGWWAWIGEAL